MFKFEGQRIYHIYWSLGSQLSYKKSLLVICKISKLFPNTLSADGKYSLLIKTIQRNEFRWNYLENKKVFWNCFLDFWNLVLIWNIFKKKMTLIADVFRKLRTAKNIVRSIPKNSLFRESVEKQRAKCAQRLFKFEGQSICHIYWSLGSQLSYKKSLLMKWKISNLFPNTLTADGEYSVLIETI